MLILVKRGRKVAIIPHGGTLGVSTRTPVFTGISRNLDCARMLTSARAPTLQLQELRDEPPEFGKQNVLARGWVERHNYRNYYSSYLV